MFIKYISSPDIDDGLWWVCTNNEQLVGFDREEDAQAAVDTYNDYRSEGQSHVVSKQYAGLL